MYESSQLIGSDSPKIRLPSLFEKLLKIEPDKTSDYETYRTNYVQRARSSALWKIICEITHGTISASTSSLLMSAYMVNSVRFETYRQFIDHIKKGHYELLFCLDKLVDANALKKPAMISYLNEIYGVTAAPLKGSAKKVICIEGDIETEIKVDAINPDTKQYFVVTSDIAYARRVKESIRDRKDITIYLFTYEKAKVF